MITASMKGATKHLKVADKLIDDEKEYSSLSHIHLAAEEIANTFIFQANEAPTIRRTIDRLYLENL